MLRLFFVLIIIAVGTVYAFQGAFPLLLFYLWNAYFRPEFWVWTDILFSLRLSLVIGTLLLLTSFKYLGNIRATGLVILVFAFFAQCTIALVLSAYFDSSLTFWIEFLKVILVAVLITVLVDDEQKLRLTLLVIAYSLGIETAKQGWAQLIFNPGATNINTHPLLGDNNGVALGMMMLLPIFLALAQTATSRWERHLHRFFIVGVLYRSVSTYSRGGFITAAVIGLIILFRSPKKFRMAIGAAVLATAVLSVMPQGFWDRMGTVTEGTKVQDESAQGRLYYWGIALDMANDHPIAGVGINAYRHEMGKYGEEQGRAVHSIWFGVLGDLGYPGLILFAAVAIGGIWSCQRTRTTAIRDGRKGLALFSGYLQISLVAYCVAGTFLSQQYLEFYWHIIGLVVAMARIRESVPSVNREAVPVPAVDRRVRIPDPRVRTPVPRLPQTRRLL